MLWDLIVKVKSGIGLLRYDFRSLKLDVTAFSYDGFKYNLVELRYDLVIIVVESDISQISFFIYHFKFESHYRNTV